MGNVGYRMLNLFCVVIGYIMLNFVCVVVTFMMQKLGDTVQPCKNENDEQLPERVVLDGVSIKGSCSAAHTDTHEEISVPSEDSIRQLICHLMDVKDLIPLQLEHDWELDVLYISPRNIRDFMFGHKWMDVGILQLGACERN